METYQLHTNKKLLIFSSNEQFFMIDTGAPFSLARSPFRLNGNEFSAPQNNPMMHVNISNISEFLDISIHAFLGCNILKNFDWRIRWNDNEIDVGSDLPYYTLQLPLENIGGGPYFTVMLNNQPTKAFFDTGAHISYIDSSYITNQPSIRSEEDFNPLYGSFEAPIYEFDVSLGQNNAHTLEFGILPRPFESMTFGMMKPWGITTIIGTELLKHYNCTISWKNNIASFAPV